MLEKFLIGLMQQAGVEPAQIAHAYQFVSGLEAELAAFKGGVPKVIGHYNTRLDTIERKLDHLITTLAATDNPARPALPPGVTVASGDYAPVITHPPLNGGSHE